MPDLPNWSDEYREQRRMYAKCCQEFSELYEQHKHLVEHVEPNLTALYLKAIGFHQYEVLKLRMEIKLINMRIDLLRQYINRDETPDIGEVNKVIDRQQEEYNELLRQRSEALFNAEAFLSQPLIDKEEALEIKRLYQAIVKAVHPDLNPDATPDMIDAFRKATEYYNMGALDQLRELYQYVVINQNYKKGYIPDVDLAEKISFLQEKIETLKETIKKLHQTFPYMYAENLEDQEWIDAQVQELEEEQKELLARKKHLLEVVTLLEEYESQDL